MSAQALGAIVFLTLVAGPALAMPAKGPMSPVTPAGRTGLLVDLNETRIAVLGGYGGERLKTASLSKWRDLDGVIIYRAAGRTGRYYADRDGDGRIDAGVVYVPTTGMVLIDWNCDGRGNRILTDLSPPDARVPLWKRLEQ
jgi:hypothetical protein